MRSFFSGLLPALVILLIPGSMQAQATANHFSNTKNKEAAMSTTDRNKEMVKTLYEQALNKGNMNLLQDLVADSYTGPQGAKGALGFAGPVSQLIKAFPDIHWNIQDLFGEGQQVVVRWVWHGTQTERFRDIAATGKVVTNEGMAIYEFGEGKITGVHMQTDRLGFWMEMGVLPLK